MSFAKATMKDESSVIFQPLGRNRFCICLPVVLSVRLARSDSDRYEFVGSKQRYSKFFRSQTVERVLSSTAVRSARMQQTPISTILRFHHEATSEMSNQVQKQAWAAAYHTWIRECFPNAI